MMHNGRAGRTVMATFHEEQPYQQQSNACPGPVVPGHQIQCYEEQHCWIIDHVLLPCSVAEYRCLKLLLEQVNTCVPFSSFLSDQESFPTACANAKQERSRVAYIMSRLRAKLWTLGFDIANVWNVGYILLLLSEPQHGSLPESPTPPDS